MNHILNHWFKPFDDNLIHPAVETLNYKQSVSQHKRVHLERCVPTVIQFRHATLCRHSRSH